MKETPQCVEDINEKRKRAKENQKGAQDFNTMIENDSPESARYKRITRTKKNPKSARDTSKTLNKVLRVSKKLTK